jgi:hypothetical protein
MVDIDLERLEDLASEEAAWTRARTLAERMPLCHFPASTRLADWSEWLAFASRSARSGAGPSTDPSAFQRLLDDHVFAYAGPCCFAEPSHNGDAVAFFGPDAALDAELIASPFDTGTLGPKRPRLQPYANEDESTRWAFLERCKIAAPWRARFAGWLRESYDDPNRYLETTTGNRHRDGRPTRLKDTPELLEHNSAERAHGGVRCADRRAWTWEVRCAEALKLQHLSLLWVAPDALEDATSAARKAEARGRYFDVEQLGHHESATGSAFYAESGKLLLRLLGDRKR